MPKPKVTELPKKEQRTRKRLCKKLARGLRLLNRLAKKAERVEDRLQKLTAHLPTGTLAKVSASTAKKISSKKVAAVLYP